MKSFFIYISLGVLLNLLIDIIVNLLVKYGYSNEEDIRWNNWLKIVATFIWPIVLIIMVYKFIEELAKNK